MSDNSTQEDEGIVVVVESLPIEGYDDGSTVVVFRGICEDEIITFGVDHRMARDIVNEIEAASDDGGNVAMCLVEDWQVLSRTPL